MQRGVSERIPYFYHAIYDLAAQLESYTLINQRDFKPETVEYLKTLIPQFQETYRVIRNIDYLFAGIISEDQFMKEHANES
jgi:hypothetical protein